MIYFIFVWLARAGVWLLFNGLVALLFSLFCVIREFDRFLHLKDEPNLAVFSCGQVILPSLLAPQSSLSHLLVANAFLMLAISQFLSYCLVICIALLLSNEFAWCLHRICKHFANFVLFSCGPCTSITFDNPTITFTGCK